MTARIDTSPYKTEFSNICHACSHVHYTLSIPADVMVVGYCVGDSACSCGGYVTPPHPRPTWDETWMKVADTMAERSTCPRLAVGAVVVKDNHLLASGYNGAVRGARHCLDVGCTVVKGHCMAVHAEANCVAEAGRHGVSLVDATIYCRHGFCVRCASLLIQAGIKEAVYVEMYSNGTDGVISLLTDSGVDVRQINV